METIKQFNVWLIKNDYSITGKQFDDYLFEELEKEPAYKRLGLDLTDTDSSSNRSRMSLGSDSNNEMQLRSNNSFLHDNVD